MPSPAHHHQLEIPNPEQVQQEAPPQPDFFERRFAASLSLILILSGCFYLAFCAGRPEFAYAEAPFCLIPREMMTAGNFISPLFHSVPYYDKPILSYWLIIVAYKVLGASLFASRVPSVIYALGTIGVVAASARRLFGGKCAILSALVLATSFRFATFASSSMPDMLLVLLDTCTMVALYAYAGCSVGSSLACPTNTRVDRKRALCLALAGLSAGLAFMTKGPIGVILPAGVFLLYLAITKQLKILKVSHVLLSGAGFLLIALPWHLAAIQRDGLQALEWMYLTGNVRRFIGSVGSYNFDHLPFYMLITTITGFLPWSVLLPLVMVASWRQRRQNWQQEQSRLVLYLWLWIVATIAFFSISRSNWGYYSLPVYPASAILIGLYLDKWTKNKPAVAKFAPAVWAVLIAATLAGSGYAFFKLRPDAAKKPAYIIASILKQQPTNCQFLFEEELNEQFNLYELIRLELGKELLCVKTNDLASRLSAGKPFVCLITKTKFESLPAQMQSKMKVVDSLPFNMVKLPSHQMVDLLLVTSQ